MNANTNTARKSLAELKEIRDYEDRVRHEDAIEAALDAQIADARELDEALSAAPAPKKIRFETTPCTRCDGYGKSLHWGLSNNTCFSCQGAGYFLTQDGKAAKEAWTALTDEVRKNHGGLIPDAVMAELMKDTAAEHPGATLVY